MELIGKDARLVSIEPPVNVSSRDRHIFPPSLKGELPEQKVRRLTDVTAFGRGPLRQDSNYMVESFVIPRHYDEWKKKWGHVRQSLERQVGPRRTINSPVVWITDNWSCGYYHWLCDALPRLELALQHYPANELTLVLPYKFRRHGYFMESLKSFGLKETRILGRFEKLLCRDMIFPCHLASSGRHDPDMIHLLRERFQKHFGDLAGRPGGRLATKAPRRVYISRSVATRRRIANEQDIMPVLKRHGFQKLLAERMSWEEQIATMLTADCLLSNHGSGLANMLAMRAGTSVLEIRERCDTTQGCFWGLASAAKLKYYYMLADKDDANKSAHWSDVRVDPSELRRSIELMLESQARVAV
ncbi:MAG: glycosyltransferase family 61 protein [Pirellulaceae bacterium]